MTRISQMEQLPCGRRPHCGSRRGGFSLLEMMVASASATILLVGLASSIFVVGQAFDAADGATVRQLDAGFAADELLTDLHFATKFTERTATAVTFQVPDRDGDGFDETLRYAWGGTAGSPLTKAVNGSAPEAILNDVASLNLAYVTRTLTGLEEPETFVPQVYYEEFTERRETKATTEVKVARPNDTQAGDLLVFAIAVSGQAASNLTQPFPGWNLVVVDNRNDQAALGVWWRIATDNEPKEYVLNYGQSSMAYAWVMRFTGHDASTPITAFATSRGTSFLAMVPTVSYAHESALVLRLGAFQGNRINPDSPGASGHQIITVDDVTDYSAAAAYQENATGSTGTTAFFLSGFQAYVTATIVIQPSMEPL